jgi:hypothetical protein
MEAKAHTYIDNKKKARHRRKNAIHSVLVLFFYSRKGDDGHLFFFSSRMGIEKEKIAKEEMFMPSTFYTSVHARSFASCNSTIKRTTGRERDGEKNSSIIALRKCRPICNACMYEL